MKLDPKLVHHVAALSRLALSPGDEARAGEQLTRILEAFESLQAVDTAGVAPTVVLAEPAALRDDVVEGELGHARALANAPEKVGTSFAVPKFLE